MKEDGIFSFIIPNNWLTINTSIDFRKFIISKSNIIVLADNAKLLVAEYQQNNYKL